MLHFNSFVSCNSNRSTDTSLTPQQHSSFRQLNSPLAGAKRKVNEDRDTDKIPCKQTAWLEQHAQGGQLFCEICNVKLNSISQTLQHREGKAHLNKVKKAEEFKTVWQNSTTYGSKDTTTCNLQVNQNLPLVKQAGNVNLQCVICQKLFNSESQATQHFQSPKHNQKLKSFRDSKTGIASASGGNGSLTQQELCTGGTTHANGDPKNVERTPSPANTKTTELCCEICGLMMNSMLQMETHLLGSKHKNNIANNQLKNHPQLDLLCVDCGTTFNSQTQMIQHMKSPKHMNKKQKKQMNGMITGWSRGKGQGLEQGRGRGGAFRARHSQRERATTKPPPLKSSFVKAISVRSNHGNHFFIPRQSTAITLDFSGGPSFQQPFL